MLASKNKQKAPNKIKTIPLQSISFESPAHLNFIKTVLKPPPHNQGKNLKYARSHLSRLSILTHTLSLTNCLQWLLTEEGIALHLSFWKPFHRSPRWGGMEKARTLWSHTLKAEILSSAISPEQRGGHTRQWIKILSFTSPFLRSTVWVDTATHPHKDQN